MPSRISQMRNGQIQQSQPQIPQQPQLNEAYINQLKQYMRSANSQQFLLQAIQSNPQLKPVLQMLSNGGNPRIIYEMLARQRGIDPNWLLNKLLT